jgi:hypothetical protein
MLHQRAAAVLVLSLALFQAACQERATDLEQRTPVAEGARDEPATRAPEPAAAEQAPTDEPEATGGGPCASGDACLSAGAAAKRAGDATLAARLYAHGCDLGSGQCCARLGAMLRDGKGVAADERRAEDLFRRACSQGSQAGCDALGH